MSKTKREKHKRKVFYINSIIVFMSGAIMASGINLITSGQSHNYFPGLLFLVGSFSLFLSNIFVVEREEIIDDKMDKDKFEFTKAKNAANKQIFYGHIIMYIVTFLICTISIIILTCR